MIKIHLNRTSEPSRLSHNHHAGHTMRTANKIVECKVWKNYEVSIESDENLDFSVLIANLENRLDYIKLSEAYLRVELYNKTIEFIFSDSPTHQFIPLKLDEDSNAFLRINDYLVLFQDVEAMEAVSHSQVIYKNLTPEEKLNLIYKIL